MRQAPPRLVASRVPGAHRTREQGAHAFLGNKGRPHLCQHLAKSSLVADDHTGFASPRPLQHPVTDKERVLPCLRASHSKPTRVSAVMSAT